MYQSMLFSQIYSLETNEVINFSDLKKPNGLKTALLAYIILHSHLTQIMHVVCMHGRAWAWAGYDGSIYR